MNDLLNRRAREITVRSITSAIVGCTALLVGSACSHESAEDNASVSAERSYYVHAVACAQSEARPFAAPAERCVMISVPEDCDEAKQACLDTGLPEAACEEFHQWCTDPQLPDLAIPQDWEGLCLGVYAECVDHGIDLADCDEMLAWCQGDDLDHETLDALLACGQGFETCLDVVSDAVVCGNALAECIDAAGG